MQLNHRAHALQYEALDFSTAHVCTHNNKEGMINLIAMGKGKKEGKNK